MQQDERVNHTAHPLLDVHILRAMHRDKKETLSLKVQRCENPAGFDFLREVLNDFVNRIPCYVDIFSGDAFAKEILTASICIGHQDRTKVVNNAPVALFGNPEVVATVACFHVEPRDSKPSHYDGGQAAICIA